MRLAAACLALVACGDGIGITITVPQGVDHVDLFIGETPCVKGDNDCPGIGPPGQPLIEGDVFWIDNVEPFGTNVTAGSTEVSFLLEPGQGTLPVVVAVGSGQTVAVAILEDIELDAGAVNYVGTLVPAGEQLTLDKTPHTTAFQIWREPQPAQDAPTNRCLGVQIAEGRRVFVVPTDDFDCDDVAPAAECSVFVNGATGAADLLIDKTTCATKRMPTSNNGEHCLLGGPPCDELMPNGTVACENRQDICISDAMCCTGTAAECFAAAYKPPPVGGAALTIACTVGVIVDVGTGIHTPCMNETDPMAFVSLTSSVDATCENPKLGERKFPFDPFDDHFDYAPDPASTMTLFPKLEATACSFGLGYQGSFTSEGQPDTTVMLQFDTDSSGSGGRHSVVLPVQVSYILGCQVADECHLLPGTATDTVQTCIR